MRRLLRPTARPDRAGLTLVEVLMSMLVAGIGVLSVIVLLPLSFIRSVQAINLTNGTILRYNAEAAIDVNPRLLLRWQANQAYSAGDIIVPKNVAVAQKVTTPGTSGLSEPNWSATPPISDGTSGLTWTPVATGTYTSPIIPGGSLYPPCFVIDPLGWNIMANVLNNGLQGSLGNNGATPPVVDPSAVLRFNGELSAPETATLGVTLPDSWVEQARAPVVAGSVTPTSVTLSGVDLTSIAYSTPAAPVTVAPFPANPVISRIVLIDATGKASVTRIITLITPATGIVNWIDPLPGAFTPVAARVETQDTRYTWIFTVRPSSAGGSSNVTVTVFFNRPVVSTDETVYSASGSDGVGTPFTINYSAGQKPFVKKGGFLFDCYFGRWYRITNIVNDTGTSLQVYVDSPRPQTDVLANPIQTFGAVFMRGVVDVFPLPNK